MTTTSAHPGLQMTETRPWGATWRTSENRQDSPPTLYERVDASVPDLFSGTAPSVAQRRRDVFAALKAVGRALADCERAVIVNLHDPAN